MTKKQREQVVELLRCAADVFAQHRFVFLDTLGAIIGSDNTTYINACKAFDDTASHVPRPECPGDLTPAPWNLTVCLEAAARVEEGSWP